MMQTYGKLIFLPPTHCPIIFHTLSPLFSQMSPIFQVPWDIVPSYEISRQNTVVEWKSLQILARLFLRSGCSLLVWTLLFEFSVFSG